MANFTNEWIHHEIGSGSQELGKPPTRYDEKGLFTRWRSIARDAMAENRLMQKS